MNRSLAPKFVTLLLCIMFVGCVTAAPPGGAERSDLETAELRYAQSSIAYEATMISLQDARALGREVFPDAQWQRVMDLQMLVQRHTPTVRSLLNLWRTSGEKPANIGEVLDKIVGAGVELTSILVSVQAKTPKGGA